MSAQMNEIKLLLQQTQRLPGPPLEELQTPSEELPAPAEELPALAEEPSWPRLLRSKSSPERSQRRSKKQRTVVGMQTSE
mmetsp:Transcript_105909/g.188370  ORF Transcript_105909/g.188370 Transcript_105909/m.188370 type:complete len:80 (+) Transcript_105909:2-241(+)